MSTLMGRAIPQWCGGCKQTRTIECTRTGCPTAIRLAEEAHYAQVNCDLLEAAEAVSVIRPSNWDDDDDPDQAPALALCAAALRARARASSGEGPTNEGSPA